MSEKYYSYDGERYDLTEIADAIEMQIEENSKIGDVVTIWEGERKDIDTHPDCDSLIESMQESASEEVGEFADSWLTDITSIQAAELQSGLDSLIDNWLEAHNHHPSFYAIKNAEEVEIRLTNFDGDGGFEWERVSAS